MGLLTSIASTVLGDKLSKKSEEGRAQEPIYPTDLENQLNLPEAGLREGLISRLSSRLANVDQGVAPEKIAGLSNLENQGLSRLGQVQVDPYKLNPAAAEEINKTLTGAYDPATSEYYKAYKDQAQRELTESQSRLNEALAGGGKYFHGARASETGKLEENYITNLAMQSAQLAERERERRIQAVPLAQSMSQTSIDQPLQVANAYLEGGQLPRRIEQAGYTAEKQASDQTRGEEQNLLSTIIGYLGARPLAYGAYPPQEEGSGLLQTAGTLLGNIPWESIFKSKTPAPAPAAA